MLGVALGNWKLWILFPSVSLFQPVLFWADWQIRKDKYSDAQKEYFAQMPDQRSDQFVKGILDKLEKEIQSL